MNRSFAQSPNYKWWAFSAIAIATFMSVIDFGSVAIALPSIQDHFEVGLTTVQWVMVGYILTISILLLPMGKLADIIGTKEVYVAGLSIFLVGAIVGGFSNSLIMLVGARILQGAGSAMIQANGMAMITSVFPEKERGKALGLHVSVVGTGAVVGPALGGLIVGISGWQSLFFLNAGVAGITVLSSILILDRSRLASLREGPRQTWDWLGTFLSGGALLSFLLLMTNGSRVGWTSGPIVVAAIAFLVLLAAFIWWELRTSSPMLDLRLFKRRPVALGFSSGWISFFGNAPVMFLMPFYLRNLLGYSALKTGLVFIPGAIMLTIMAPLSGRLSDRFGARPFMIVGLALGSTALFLLATTITRDSSLLLIVSLLVLLSAGIGMFGTPNHSSILSGVERSKLGVVSALIQLMRNSANVTGIALSTAIVVATMASMGFEPSLSAVSDSSEVASAFVSGLHRTFLVIACIMVVGVVLAFLTGYRAHKVDEPVPESTVSERPSLDI